MEPIAMNGMELGKRKRSPSSSSAALLGAPSTKSSKTSTTNSLSINYLARQTPDDLPLLNKDDSLPNLINLIAAYSSVLDRHESLASNLGARPLGPILIKRFERCFDAPPKIVASHQKISNGSGHQEETPLSITWLEVIEFARSHPGKFTLSTFSEGQKVCQFYFPQKQLRVQISEEDFLFINSGRCQELIPPLPIWEDEEKEVGACDVLDAKLRELTNVADMVAARTRQLSHRLKNRRAAIIERRAEGGSGTPAKAGVQHTTTAPPLTSSNAGFRPVNNAETRNRPAMNDEGGDVGQNAFTAVRSELLRHFESLPHNQNVGWSQSRHPSTAGFPEIQTPLRPFENMATDPGTHVPISTASSLSPNPPNFGSLDHSNTHTTENARQAASNGIAPAYHRPASSANAPVGQGPSKHNFSRPLNPALESTQPFRPFCQAHMDSLPRGHRVIPPCDRCRRLRMDCVKNLTSCAGCTKKHARCHWRDVSRDELGSLDHILNSSYPDATEDADSANGHTNGRQAESDDDEDDDDDGNPLEDLMALGEREDHQLQDEAQSIERHHDNLDIVSRTPHMHTETSDTNVIPNAGYDARPQDEEDSIRVAAHKRQDIQSMHKSLAVNQSVLSGYGVDQSTDMSMTTAVTHGGFRPVNNVVHG